MGEMKVNIATLRQAQSQLQTARRELNQLLPRFSRVQSQLRDTWDGGFAQAYVDMLVTERLKGEKVLHEIELLSGYIDSTIKKMEEYDRQWAARLLALAQEAARQAAQRLAEAAREANKPLKDVVKTPAKRSSASSTNLGALANKGIPSIGR